MEDVLSIYNQPSQPGRARICFDERPCQLLDEVVAALRLKPGQPAKEDNEYIRQGTCAVLLAYDLDTVSVMPKFEDDALKQIIRSLWPS